MYAQKNNQFQTRASPSDGHSGVKVNKVSGLRLVSDGQWVCAKDSVYWWSSVKIQLNPGWLGSFVTWFFQALPARVCLKGNINSNNSNFTGSCSHLMMKGFWLHFFCRIFSKSPLFLNIKSALFLMQFFINPMGGWQNRNMNDWHHMHSSPLITKIQLLTQAHPVCLLLPLRISTFSNASSVFLKKEVSSMLFYQNCKTCQTTIYESHLESIWGPHHMKNNYSCLWKRLG